MAAHARAHGVAELIVNPEPGAILPPGAPGLIGRLPLGQIVRHQPPGTAATQHRLDTIEHLPHRVFAGATAGLFWRQQGRQDLPLLIGQVCRVGRRWAAMGVAPSIADGSWVEASQRLLYSFLNSL